MLPALLQALRLAIFSQGYPKINPRPRDPGTPPLLLTLNVAKKCGPLLFIYDLPCVRRPLWREILVDQGIQKRCIFDPPADAPPGYHQHGPRLLLAGNIVVRRVSFDWACKQTIALGSITWRSKKQMGKSQTAWSAPSGFRQCLHAPQCRTSVAARCHHPWNHKARAFHTFWQTFWPPSATVEPKENIKNSKKS